MNLVNEITYNNITYKVGDVIKSYLGIKAKIRHSYEMKIEAIDLETNIILTHSRTGCISGIKPSLITEKMNYTFKVRKQRNHRYLEPINYQTFINIFNDLLKDIPI